MQADFKTISGSCEAEYEISKSKFISYVANVESETEAIDFIQKIKKTHWEATHNCSAYTIGENDQIQKADDDGEPSGTAGRPILEVIKKNNLKNVAIVVTRYFGGIKLGAGGLIRAYSKSATIGIETATIVTRVHYRKVKVVIDYTLLSLLENNLKFTSYKVYQKDFTENVALILLANLGSESTLIEDLVNWTASNCLIELLDEVILDEPI